MPYENVNSKKTIFSDPFWATFILYAETNKVCIGFQLCQPMIAKYRKTKKSPLFDLVQTFLVVKFSECKRKYNLKKTVWEKTLHGRKSVMIKIAYMEGCG